MPVTAADLERLRRDGWPSHDPVRWRFIEALAARAAAGDAALRERLETRVAVLLADYRATMAARATAASPADAAPLATAGAGSTRPLAALLAHIATHASPSAELRTLQRFRRTWSRLTADQRVLRSRMHLPRNAGPLNSQHLVHRALTLMRDLSPDYLEHFVAHADALLWLDRASGGDLPARKDVPPPTGGGTRGKTRSRR